MPSLTLHRVPASTVQPLRFAILRPDRPYAESIYPHDDDPETLHVALMRDGVVLGSVTAMRQPIPEQSDPTQWRLRGVTLSPELRGSGYGKMLINIGIGYAARQGASLLWFISSEYAVPIYLHLGFMIRTDLSFLDPNSPNPFMWRPLTPEDRDLGVSSLDRAAP